MPVFCLQKPFFMQPFLSPWSSHNLQLSITRLLICFLSMAKSKAYHALGLLCLMLLMQKCVVAREFAIGGKGNWGVPTDNTSLNYNQWAERTRFQIGDSLVFNYASEQDSVLQVNKDAYADCNTEYPVARYTDGHTVFTFNQSGPYYFISGNKDNCLNNEKLVVIVLADRSNRYSPPPSPSSDVVPPEGTVEVNPTPAPELNKPSAASSTFISFVSSIGTFAASSLLLAF